MSYFSKFPAYISRTVDNNQIIITDFFKRVSQSQRASDKTSIMLPYIITDGETPEIIANKLYGTPFYHWVLLLINDITNPRTEWPLESKYVYELLFEKYNFVVTVPDSSQFAVGDIVTSTPEGGEFIVVDIIDNDVLLRSRKGVTTIAITDTTLTNVTQNITNLSVTSVIDPTEGIFHYVDVPTGLVVDFANDPNIVPVTNFEYEEELNEEKRLIKILDPQFLDLFVRNFDAQINE
jgi:hypothetical protein